MYAYVYTYCEYILCMNWCAYVFIHIICIIIIKSPRYTGGDFMFLYLFVRRRRRHCRPQILVQAITF